MKQLSGSLQKMKVALNVQNQARYQLHLGQDVIDLNEYLGCEIEIVYQGKIQCQHCGKPTKKSYSQGFCFPCMQSLARCDMCIMKPETCHFDQGTCREPDWGDANCNIPHFVYLANSSGIKVGITRHSQIPTRWIDQGAVAATPIFKVNSRKLSGLVEVILAKHIADKTNWRTMLKGQVEDIDFVERYQALKPKISDQIATLKNQFGADAIIEMPLNPVTIQYPVLQYPTKIVSHNLDKQPIVTGILQGIKGQYLLLDTGVINLRKFTAYQVDIRIQHAA